MQWRIKTFPPNGKIVVNPDVQYIHGESTIVVNVLIPDLHGSHGGAPLDLIHVLTLVMNHLAIAFVFIHLSVNRKQLSAPTLMIQKLELDILLVFK